MPGTVIAIHVAPSSGAETTTLARAELVAGRGIVGDRYYREASDPSREVTLVAAEQLEQVNAETGFDLSPGETRRNIVTRGVALNDLVGERFMVGEVTLYGVELCEPCRSLGERLAVRLGRPVPEIVARLVHRSGLRAQVINGGAIRPGDAVSAV